MTSRFDSFSVLLVLVGLLYFSTPSLAFGAGNIASISKIEGKNWRHGDIEDTLKTLVFLKGGKWTSKMVKRVYFVGYSLPQTILSTQGDQESLQLLTKSTVTLQTQGNWLRDYSQAVDVGTLKGVPAGTLRILVSVLGFMSFGYATEEYEVTDERLGCYRPEEHIDNPKDYADNLDARAYDPRLRPPVHPMELAIDPNTGMKNYIANESGGWATSSGYVKYSLDRSIHYGRLYTSGHGDLGKRDADLCEALRCLGQALHTLEDFSAHSNYCELVLRELGFDAFSHCGSASQISLRGKHVFPIVTGTFGGLDFLHSVLGEAQDKLTQNELEEVDLALEEAHDTNKKSSSSSRGFGGSSGGDSSSILQGLLAQLPGSGNLGSECSRLQADSDAQEFANMNIGSRAGNNPNDPYQQPSQGGAGGAGGAGGGINAYNPEELSRKIFPILQFRDRVMRSIEAAIEKIPGLTALVEKISEGLSIFVFSILAPFIRPIIAQVSVELGKGSDSVLSSSATHQYEPWTDPQCTDPTHSLLSKDHFSNRLNEPCGNIASAVVSYVVPRIVFAWENPNTPVQMVLDDVCRVFHHPTIRDPQCEIHNTMFTTVKKWVDHLPDRGQKLNTWLGPQGVRQGLNHTNGVFGGGLEGGHGKIKDSDLANKDKNKRSGGRPQSGSYNNPLSSIAGAIGGSGLQNTVGGFLSGVGIGGAAGSGGGGGGSSGDYYSGGKEKKKYKDKDFKDRDYKEKDYREKEYRSKDYKEKDKYHDKEKSEKKHKKSSSSGGHKVKDEDYYRRKAERKARKEREGKSSSSKKKDKHKTRSVEDDSEDSDDYDSEASYEDRSGGGHRRGHSESGRSRDRSGDRDRERDRRSRDHPDAHKHDEFRDPHHQYSRGAQEDAYLVPGGYPAAGSKADTRPPYPVESGADYALSQGYVIGGDGVVRRESPYEYPESGHHHYPQESDYVPSYGSRGADYEPHSPAPQPHYQDFGYGSGGGEYHGTTYDGGSRYGYGYQ